MAGRCCEVVVAELFTSLKSLKSMNSSSFSSNALDESESVSEARSASTSKRSAAVAVIAPSPPTPSSSVERCVCCSSDLSLVMLCRTMRAGLRERIELMVMRMKTRDGRMVSRVDDRRIKL